MTLNVEEQGSGLLFHVYSYCNIEKISNTVSKFDHMQNPKKDLYLFIFFHEPKAQLDPLVNNVRLDLKLSIMGISLFLPQDPEFASVIASSTSQRIYDVIGM